MHSANNPPSPHCPLCRRERAKLRYRIPSPWQGELLLHECRGCHFAFLTSRTDEAYDDDYYIFASWMAAVHERLDRRRWAELSGKIQGAHLVDVGCARGGFLRAAKQAGMDVRGIEPNRRLAELLTRDGIDVHVGMLGQTDYAKGWAHTAVSFDVIEHAADPVGFLSHVRELLAPGGLAIIETPNYGQFARTLMGRNWYAFNPYHASLFTKQSLALAARRAGLEPVRTETPHIGLTHVLLRLACQVGIEGMLRLVLRGDRRGAYEPGRDAPGPIALTVAGSMVYQFGPLNAVCRAMGVGDKLRMFMRNVGNRG